MKKEIKTIFNIRPLSLAKILMLFGLLQGLIFGIQTSLTAVNAPLSLAEAISYAQQDPSIAPLAIMVSIGWWALLVGPIIFAIIMFISGLLIALIYNLFAKLIGGVKIELN